MNNSELKIMYKERKGQETKLTTECLSDIIENLKFHKIDDEEFGYFMLKGNDQENGLVTYLSLNHTPAYVYFKMMEKNANREMERLMEMNRQIGQTFEHFDNWVTDYECDDFVYLKVTIVAKRKINIPPSTHLH